MTLISRLISRVLGPVCVLGVLGVLLAPMMAQRSARIVDADPLQLVDARLGATLSLVLPAMLLAIALWLPIALLLAFRRGSAGLVSAPGTVLAQALAPFVTGLVLLLTLGVGAGLLPVTGSGTPAHLIMPSITLAVMLVGVLSHASYLRASARHAAEVATGAPNESSPLLEIADDWLDTLSRYAGAFVGAIVVVETIFPGTGVGRLLTQAVTSADHPVTSAAVYRLIGISVALTALFGLGAAFTGEALDHRRSPSSASASDTDGVNVWGGPSSVRSRRFAVAALALGTLVLLALLVVAATPTADPMTMSLVSRLVAPGQDGHLLGTDALGRDIAARLIYGLRTTLLVAVSATMAAAVVGVPFGLLAAVSRVGDLLVSAVVDSVLVVPALVFGIVVSSAMGPSASVFAVVIPPVMVFVLARLTRDAARASWAGGHRHFRPALGPILLALFGGLAIAIVLEATIDFFGLGTLPPTPALGEMLSSGRLFLARGPWLMVYPGLTLTALVASMLLLGYGSFDLLRPRPATVSSAAHETSLLVAA